MANPAPTLIQCLRLVLRPVVRYCLRKSLTIQDLLESAKVVFIDVASEEMHHQAKEVTLSRLRVTTGINRRELMRIYNQGESRDSGLGLVARVIGAWQQDPAYTTKNNRPRILSFEGGNSEFHELVAGVSTDIKPPSVLFELERIGAVEQTSKGLKLKASGYLPKQDTIESFRLLSYDIEELMDIVEENVFGEDSTRNLHATTEFDNISEKDLAHLREWVFKEGSAFHKRVRDYIAKYDLDYSKKQSKTAVGGGGRVVLGTFARINKDNE